MLYRLRLIIAVSIVCGSRQIKSCPSFWPSLIYDFHSASPVVTLIKIITTCGYVHGMWMEGYACIKVKTSIQKIWPTFHNSKLRFVFNEKKNYKTIIKWEKKISDKIAEKEFIASFKKGANVTWHNLYIVVYRILSVCWVFNVQKDRKKHNAKFKQMQ